MKNLQEKMKFDNSKVRRQDRLLDEAEATELLRKGEYGIMSMTGKDSEPYGIPVNFAWDGACSIYIHCAHEGRKLECLRNDPRASFCIVGHTNVVSSKFTTGYESIVLKCTASTHLEAEERMHALKLILEKYSPEDMAIGLKYAEKSFARTEIIRLDITSWSGKCKRVK